MAALLGSHFYLSKTHSQIDKNVPVEIHEYVSLLPATTGTAAPTGAAAKTASTEAAAPPKPPPRPPPRKKKR